MEDKLISYIEEHLTYADDIQVLQERIHKCILW